MNRSLAVVVTLACLALPSARARAQDDVELLEQETFRAAVDRVAPSVVRIETVGGLERIGKVLFGTGPTSGLIVGEDGYIVSSAFNFLNQPASILVQSPGGDPKPAQLVATDHNRMVVLLKIDVDEPLAVPEMVPRAEMRVGMWTIAVGRTFASDRPNMSVGILSAVNRVWGKAVQTDAAVSPNNYGGPLVDLRGRVFGVLVPLSPKAAKEIAGVEWYDSGIGFAVPGQDLEEILDRLKKGEDLYPGVVGISFTNPNLALAEPVIATVRPNSPAYEAGFKTGDRVLEVDGHEIARAADVKQQISRRYAGDVIRMVVTRDDQRIEREMELAARLEPYEHPMLGILPMRTVPGQAGEAAGGVPVRYVYPEGPAARAGIAPGDVLVALAGEPIRDADQLRARISEQQPDDSVELEVRRGQETLKLAVVLGRLPEELPAGPLPKAHAIAKPEPGERPQVGTIELKIPEFENDAWAYVPEDYNPAVAHGLVVWLHAPDGFDADELIARWIPHCDRDGLILLAPKSSDPKKWQPQEVTLVRKLMDEVISTYTVDPTRVVVHGHQGGGSLGCLVAFGHRDLVRAVAAVDAVVAGRPPQNEPAHRLAFYLAKAEESEHADRIEATVTRLRELKYPVSVKDLGEKARDLNAEELAELVRWIDTLDRI